MPDAHKLRGRITAIHAQAGKIENDQLKAEVAKHLCVLASGLIEATVRDAVESLVVTTKPNQRIGNAATAFAKNLNTPSRENIRKLLAKIDKPLSVEFEAFLEANAQSASSLKSIVSNRHLIAHGRDVSGLSVGRMKQYLDDIEEVLKIIAKLGKR